VAGGVCPAGAEEAGTEVCVLVCVFVCLNVSKCEYVCNCNFVCVMCILRVGVPVCKRARQRALQLIRASTVAAGACAVGAENLVHTSVYLCVSCVCICYICVLTCV